MNSKFYTVISVLAVLLSAFILIANAQVEGSITCGGRGTFISMESSGCVQAPCNLTVNTPYTMGITFIAGETTNSVLWQVWLYRPEGGVTRIQEIPVVGTIVVGESYRVINEVTLAERFAGEPGEVAIMLLNQANGDSRIICGEFQSLIAEL